ncbi:FtsK/SpoIIIE domain-containing protein [Sphaerisporangium rubeum]|uniref:S-DNA-T family DNA segregation ATPase FtsK/SpoIIIE n=1 Tax=Sphaerisporangium rubeum TaxID=321317 RepID=A0A7X0IGL3_9ACTN|nr:FtsK/SpoIIIE domain-containing protein [Sphaerisporangium rubeum]MBB6474854.1 S-DNA-T family DNA segregation ATPase FtsK/SpoIIIE [Sphaerisporangium rubeum]
MRVVTDGRETAVVLRAGPGATVADLVRALPAAGLPPCSGVPLWLDGHAVPQDRPLAELRLPAGARLEFASHPVSPAGTASPSPGLEVAVAGGAGGAASAPLVAGTALTVGRAAGGLTLADPEVSRTHATLLLTPDGDAELSDAGSRNGVAWQGVRLDGSAVVAPGEVFGAGETVLAVRESDPADAPVEAAGDVLLFNRPPRIPLTRPAPVFTVPRRPDEPRRVRFPVVAIVLPLVLAAAAYALFPGAGYFLIFLALSPVLMLANVVSDRRGGRREHREAVKEYERRRALLEEALAAAAGEQGRTGRDALPDPARLLRVATGPTRRLFERRPHDEDFLRLRVGLAATPVEAAFTGPGTEEPPERPVVHHAPVAIDLAAAGVLGVAGPREAVLATARAVLAHLAVLHGPHDAGLVVLTGAEEAADWEWVTWLPHSLPHSPDFACRRMVATDARQAGARLAELGSLVAERRAERRATLRAGGPSGRRLVVVADRARRLRELPGLAELLAEGPEAGVYAICLDDDETSLPDECRATVVVTSASGTRARVRRPDGSLTESVLLDRLPAGDALRLGHAMAPIRVLGGRSGGGAELPASVGFLELAGLGATPTPEEITRRWAAGGPSTAVTLGVGAEGPVTVDLRRDGPHALIAGTSGAGKSELLQTLVAGLALGNTPEALSMVLVDYKGGSAFAECRDLPHCAGMVTDLDGHLVSRALASLDAELKRRERLFAEAGAKDIEDYLAAGRALPRLVIVIDEFASLVEEVPEFVTGVVGIGMRGRSLGVHVVLATQRPAGVVNAELRANLNLRICLRVTSASDSGDVIDVPDAARLSRHVPGRAYLRAGHSDLTLLQVARAGRPRELPGTGAAEQVTVTRRTVAEAGSAAPVTAPPPAGQDRETDLGVLVAAVRDAATRGGARTAPSPWLPPLPELVTVDDLDAGDGGLDTGNTGLNLGDGGRAPFAVPLGLGDHPGEQAQRPFLLDLERTGPLLVAGMARSGRSTVLRTLAVELARRHGPADAHLYLLDQGNRALAPLAALPHCGAHVDGDDADRTARVLALLNSEVDRRQRLLSAGGYASPAEQRAACGGDALPYLVLMLDGYETFVARYADLDGGRLVDALDGLLRRGPAAGVVTVISTDRSGFTQRLAGATAARLVLRHADRDDLAAYGINPREAPRAMPPGRAIAVPSMVETQIAMLDADPEGAAQVAAVERFAQKCRRRWDGVPEDRLPHPVDPLPSRITAAEAGRLRRTPAPPEPTVCTIGVGGDRLGPVDLDLAGLGHVFLVAGPARSGRSGALLAVARSLTTTGRPGVTVGPHGVADAAAGPLGTAGTAAGAYGTANAGAGPHSAAGPAAGSSGAAMRLPVIAVCPRQSPLRTAHGVAAVLDGGDAEALRVALHAQEGPCAVLVDDAELLADGPCATVLEDLARTARDRGHVLVAAGTTEDLQMQRYRGWLSAVRRARTGLLLTPSSSADGDLFDLKLPSSTRGGLPPGRGLLVTPGGRMTVQVPLCDEEIHG